jgi:hypothetical protein
MPGRISLSPLAATDFLQNCDLSHVWIGGRWLLIGWLLVRVRHTHTIDSLESKAMYDLAYLNLLREKVRQLQAEDKRAAAIGTTPHERFVPWTVPAQSQS